MSEVYDFTRLSVFSAVGFSCYMGGQIAFKGVFHSGVKILSV